jgi:hypothetical protein
MTRAIALTVIIVSGFIFRVLSPVPTYENRFEKGATNRKIDPSSYLESNQSIGHKVWSPCFKTQSVSIHTEKGSAVLNCGFGEVTCEWGRSNNTRDAGGVCIARADATLMAVFGQKV